MPKPISGHAQVHVQTGQQIRLPLSFRLLAEPKPGHYELAATVKFGAGEIQSELFLLTFCRPRFAKARVKIALFDPKGETAKLLGSISVDCDSVDAAADLTAYDVLIVGRGALLPDSPAPDLARVRDGLKVLIFEQSSEVLEKRFGFRVEEYGLRSVFERVPDHPLLAGLGENHLRNWRGEATLLLDVEVRDGLRHAPQVTWSGIPETRLWRAWQSRQCRFCPDRKTGPRGFPADPGRWLRLAV